MWRLAVVLAIGLVTAACGSVATIRPATEGPPAATMEASEEPLPSDEPEATPQDGSGPFVAAFGEAIDISCDGDPCLKVTVVKAKFASSYKDPEGYFNDKPEHKGNVFAAVHVQYTATADSDYNPYDWGIFVDDVVYDRAFVSHGPSPELSSGDLPKGRKAQGWIVYEVPAKGRVVISYMPSNASIFEVVLRKS